MHRAGWTAGMSLVSHTKSLELYIYLIKSILSPWLCRNLFAKFLAICVLYTSAKKFLFRRKVFFLHLESVCKSVRPQIGNLEYVLHIFKTILLNILNLLVYLTVWFLTSLLWKFLVTIKYGWVCVCIFLLVATFYTFWQSFMIWYFLFSAIFRLLLSLTCGKHIIIVEPGISVGLIMT